MAHTTGRPRAAAGNSEGTLARACLTVPRPRADAQSLGPRQCAGGREWRDPFPGGACGDDSLSPKAVRPPTSRRCVRRVGPAGQHPALVPSARTDPPRPPLAGIAPISRPRGPLQPPSVPPGPLPRRRLLSRHPCAHLNPARAWPGVCGTHAHSRVPAHLCERPAGLGCSLRTCASAAVLRALLPPGARRAPGSLGWAPPRTPAGAQRSGRGGWARPPTGSGARAPRG